MAGVFSVKVAALAGLIFSVLAASASAKKPAENYNASAVSYSSSWLPARATWYGAPTGAGPDDNGTFRVHGGMMQQLLRVPLSIIAYL
jgi:hypothetical protein